MMFVAPAMPLQPNAPSLRIGFPCAPKMKPMINPTAARLRSVGCQRLLEVRGARTSTHHPTHFDCEGESARSKHPTSAMGPTKRRDARLSKVDGPWTPWLAPTGTGIVRGGVAEAG